MRNCYVFEVYDIQFVAREEFVIKRLTSENDAVENN